MGIILRTKLVRAFRYDRKASPRTVHRHEHLIQQADRYGITTLLHQAGVFVLHLGPSLLDLADQHVRRHEQVEGLEAGDDLRDVVPLGEHAIRLLADHDAHMSRLYQAVDAEVTHLDDGIQCWRKKAVARQDGEVFRDVLDQHGGGGRTGGLEAYSHEHHVLNLSGQADGVFDRVHHPDVGTAGLGVAQRADRRGHLHHVAEHRYRHAGIGQGDSVGDLGSGGHAHRAAGSLADLHAGIAQHPLQAEAHQGVLMGTAHMHEPQVHVLLADRLDDLLRGLLIPVPEHPFPPPSTSAPCSSCP